MIHAWAPAAKGLQRIDCGDQPIAPEAIWLDLVDLRPEEETKIEAFLGLDLPTRAEMQEIESSSRLYRENGAAFMTATMLVKAETQNPESSAVTFVLTRERVVTIRYAEPWTFRTYGLRAAKTASRSAEAVFADLLETTVERLADLLELVQLELDHLSQQIFSTGAALRRDQRIDLQKLIVKIGKCGHICSKVRESLLDKNRVLGFAESSCQELLGSETRKRLRAIQHDAQTLSDHATFLSGKIQFLLDATLGFINNDVNQQMKRMTMIMLAVLWPALVSGFFSMNVALPVPDDPHKSNLLPFFICLSLAFGPLLVGFCWFWWRGGRR